MAISQRQLRINEEIKRVLSEIVYQNLDGLIRVNPLIIGIQNVEVSKDMRSARVYVSALSIGLEPTVNPQQVAQQLQAHKAFIRYNLASRIKLKYTPELHFRPYQDVEMMIKTGEIW